jgi:Lrp/AsnC family leucine-responsive transcriptional regulator
MSDDGSAILGGIRDVVQSEGGATHLDETDMALLRALVEDGRISQRQLSVKLGVSAPTVSERMTRLERSGVIRGYSADINWAAVGYGQIVYLSIRAATGSDVSDVMARLWEVPEVEEMSVVTGDLDLLAKLRVEDYNHLRQVLMDSVWQIAGIQTTSTMLSIAQMPPKNFATELISRRRN